MPESGFYLLQYTALLRSPWLGQSRRKSIAKICYLSILDTASLGRQNNKLLPYLLNQAFFKLYY